MRDAKTNAPWLDNGADEMVTTMNVLLLDDDPAIHILFNSFIEEDISIVCVDSVSAAIAELKRAKYDVVFLEFVLSPNLEENGDALIKYLQTHPADYRNMQVVAITSGDPSGLPEYFRRGINGFMRKPFKKDDFKAQLTLLSGVVNLEDIAQTVEHHIGNVSNNITTHISLVQYLLDSHAHTLPRHDGKRAEAAIRAIQLAVLGLIEFSHQFSAHMRGTRPAQTVEYPGSSASLIGFERDVNPGAIAKLKRQSILAQAVPGVVHDLNGMLMKQSAALAILAYRFGESKELQAAMDQVVGMVSIVKNILRLSREPDGVKRRLEIKPLVAETLRHYVPSVRVVTQMDVEDVAIYADEHCMRQLLANLISNACQAMPDGGELSISCYNFGDEVVLSVSDTGCGMSDDVQDRLFEKFFTKGDHQGTGIGMTIISECVTSLGGAIEVDSSEGEGATFIIYIPSFKHTA